MDAVSQSEVWGYWAEMMIGVQLYLSLLTHEKVLAYVDEKGIGEHLETCD